MLICLESKKLINAETSEAVGASIIHVIEDYREG